MRVLIFAHGTRGDVQPFVALARALEGAGHTALLAAPAESASFVERYGVGFAPLDDGPNRLLDTPEAIGEFTAVAPERRRGRGRELKAMLRIMRQAKPAMARVLRDMAAVPAQDVDLVVHPPNYPGHHIAERLGVPAVAAALQPVWAPTGAFPNPMLPLPVPAVANRATYRINALALRSFAGMVDTWRRDTLGLPRRRGRHDPLRRPDGTPAPLLQAFSRHVLPQPMDYPPWVHTTGYWFPPADPEWAPPRALADFLAAGEPPVFVGFSSMPTADPERAGRMVDRAVRRAGVRAIVASGWGGLRSEKQTDEVLWVHEVPHPWLFPQVAAVVHHGGAGTTGAVLAAGRPHVVCPFHTEQRFWAHRMRECGVALDPLPGSRFSAEDLAAAIERAVTDEAMARRGRELSDQIRTEDGAVRAVRILEAEADPS